MLSAGALETPRLLLQPRMGAHADAACGPLQDEALYQWISMEKPPSLAWLRERWTRLESRLSTDGTEAWPTWAITARADGTLVGLTTDRISVQRHDERVGEIVVHFPRAGFIVTPA